MKKRIAIEAQVLNKLAGFSKGAVVYVREFDCGSVLCTVGELKSVVAPRLKVKAKKAK